MFFNFNASGGVKPPQETFGFFDLEESEEFEMLWERYEGASHAELSDWEIEDFHSVEAYKQRLFSRKENRHSGLTLSRIFDSEGTLEAEELSFRGDTMERYGVRARRQGFSTELNWDQPEPHDTSRLRKMLRRDQRLRRIHAKKKAELTESYEQAKMLGLVKEIVFPIRKWPEGLVDGRYELVTHTDRRA